MEELMTVLEMCRDFGVPLVITAVVIYVGLKYGPKIASFVVQALKEEREARQEDNSKLVEAINKLTLSMTKSLSAFDNRLVKLETEVSDVKDKVEKIDDKLKGDE